MQRTHFTPHYNLYNCVCDKLSSSEEYIGSSELNLYCIPCIVHYFVRLDIFNTALSLFFASEL